MICSNFVHQISFALLPLVLAACVSTNAPERAVQSYTFGLFGDLAYVPEREKQLDAVVADINRTPLAFVVHVGDLGSPREGSCSDALWARRIQQFSTSVNPLIYTPGDNEWTDCHDAQGVKGGVPAERLAKLRALFFQGEETFGQRRFPLTRQSGDPKFAKYRENARWDLGGVTFITLHVVGSNNNRARTAETDAEYTERLAADLSWLRAGFAHAKANNSRAIMIIQQGNMFPALPPFPGDPALEPSGFSELRGAVAKESLAFVKPVALVNGDSHFFRVDKPFMIRRSRDPVVPNFTRIETFGDPNHHWVQVTVDADDPNVFTVRPRMVAENINAE
jgi:hypothetical protein